MASKKGDSTFEMYRIIGVDLLENRTELGIASNKKESEKIKEYFKDIFEIIEIKKEKHLSNKARETIVIGDSNNSKNEVQHILKSTQFYHNLERGEAVEQLVFLGNMVGENSGFLEYMEYLISLQSMTESNSTKIPIAFIRGINEYHLIRYIQEDFYEVPDFMIPIISKMEIELGIRVKTLPKKHPKIWNFLLSTIKYYENNKYIFIPSNIYQIMSWKTTPDDYYYSFNPKFILERNLTGKTIIFGGIPAQVLTGDRFSSVWVNAAGNKICLNGCPEDDNGKILGMYITDNEHSHISSRVRHR